jgi:hypothetical protein
MNKPKPAQRDLAEWDAEIEADFQRAVAGAKAAGRRRQRNKFIGCPPEFFKRLARIPSRTSAPLVIGMVLYRRHYIVNRMTTGAPKPIGIPQAGLSELELSRWTVRRALKKLEAAALIEIHPTKPGQKTRITVLWPIG